MPKIIFDGREVVVYESPGHDALSEDIAELRAEDLKAEFIARKRADFRQIQTPLTKN